MLERNLPKSDIFWAPSTEPQSEYGGNIEFEGFQQPPTMFSKEEEKQMYGLAGWGTSITQQ